MNWVQNLLGSASVADILVYAAIIAIFVLGIAKCVMPVLNTRRLLLRAIRNILQEDYRLGVIRYAESYDKYYKALMEDKGLCWEVDCVCGFTTLRYHIKTVCFVRL